MTEINGNEKEKKWEDVDPSEPTLELQYISDCDTWGPTLSLIPLAIFCFAMGVLLGKIL